MSTRTALRWLKPGGAERPNGSPGHVRPEPVVPPRTVWTALASARQQRALANGTVFSRISYPFRSLEDGGLSPIAKTEVVEPWRAWEERESVTLIRASSFVEPELGWVICKPAHLVDNCLIDSAFAPRPRFSRYLRARVFGRPKVRKVGAIIHLRSWGENNYWHFVNDLLGGRLRLAETCRIPPGVPVLLGERAYARPFVRQLLARGALGTRGFIVQGSEYVQADEVVVFTTARSNRQNYDFVLERLGAPKGDATRVRRIFLSREEGSGRTISNQGELQDVFRAFGFDIVATERMTLEEQMKLFAEVGYLVAIHGAGLINMMFRAGAPLKVLEIFPPPQLLSWGTTPPHYCFMAQALGFDYDALITTETRQGDYRASFRVDPIVLRERIRAMLSGVRR